MAMEARVSQLIKASGGLLILVGSLVFMNGFMSISSRRNRRMAVGGLLGACGALLSLVDALEG
ncbi:MAG: hypothetical protein ACT4PT_00495 [Methanobacteriota archaeon]